jgi:hypothetical protein
MQMSILDLVSVDNLCQVNIQRSFASNRQVNKGKLTPTDRNNATDEFSANQLSVI